MQEMSVRLRRYLMLTALCSVLLAVGMLTAMLAWHSGRQRTAIVIFVIALAAMVGQLAAFFLFVRLKTHLQGASSVPTPSAVTSGEQE